jgi:dihydrofolate reductase
MNPAAATSLIGRQLDRHHEESAMRKLIVATIMSLDGYVEGPGGNVMALPMDGFFDEHNLERQRAADTLLLGATTYRGLKSYWPAVAQDPSVAEVHRETGRRNNELQKVVVSDSLTEADTAPWTDTTTIVRRADAHRAVAELKERPGQDILMFGSRTLWTDLLAAGLVDELHLMVGAAALGGGSPAFAGPTQLRLLDTRRREGSDNVLLRYGVVTDA